MRTHRIHANRLTVLVALLLLALACPGTPTGAAPPEPFRVAAAGSVAATVTLTGTVLPPTGQTFSLANRAFVRAENQEGEGTTVPVSVASGTFTVTALPGAILIRVMVQNPAWTDPTDLSNLIYYAEDGATVQVDANRSTTAVDPIQLVQKTSAISGTVTVTGTNTPVTAIPVRAWRLDGAEFEQTVTAADGSYRLPVIAGAWMLRAVPREDQAFVPAQPPIRVNVTEATTLTRNLQVVAADVTVQGRAVDATTGQLVTTLSGRVHSLYRDATGRLAVGPGAPLTNGLFTLKLAASVATTYTIGLFLPPDAGYAAQSQVSVNVASVPSSLNVPVAANNATISGALRKQDGTPLTGVAGAIYSVGERGAWARTQVSPINGSYSLPVTTSNLDGEGGTTWAVRAFIDPTSGYVMQRPRGQRVFVPFSNGDGVDVTSIDFTTLALTDFGTVRGRVLSPGVGSLTVPLAGVRVTAQAADGNTGGPLPWGFTNANGEFVLRLPAGGYTLSAHDTLLRQLRLIEPAPQRITVVAATPLSNQNLTFRRSDATITGTVSFNGAATAAIVRARATDGANVAVRVGATGSYSLPLLAGLQWQVEGIGTDQSSFLRSDKVSITPATGSNPALPLTLTRLEDLPASQGFAFDAAVAQIFTLSDGSRVEAPAGAFAASGQAMLIVRPIPGLASSAGAEPISFGYRLHAFVPNSNGHPEAVTRFNTPVTLVLPFTAAQLTALGITAEQLVPAYWDEASASWKPVETVTVTTDASGGGEVQVSVEHFTDYALVTTGERRVYLPAIMR